VALLEASNLATGRGTDTPFERVGAPWIDPAAFSADLNALRLPGVRFVPVRFSPMVRQYAGQDCGGVQIQITDWEAIDPLDVGVGLAIVLHQRYADQWEDAGFLRMIADRATVEALRAGKDLTAIRARWQAELTEFLEVRARYLLYQ
jgi:uncharacterized protein YbbC (DUF1343 family)